MILLGIFSEVIAYNMHQNIKQLHNNISACELYLVMPEFMKDMFNRCKCLYYIIWNIIIHLPSKEV